MLRSYPFNRNFLLFTLLAAFLIMVCVAPAYAAYPGENGALVYLQGDVGNNKPFGLVRSDNNSVTPIGPRCGGKPSAGELCPRDPVWSPDGRRLAFSYYDDLGIVDADGSDFRIIDLGSVRSPASPSWSPGGTILVFDAFETAGRRELYKVAADGTSAPKRVTFKGGMAPAWSSRGTIAFVREKNLFKLTRAGRVHRITTKGGYQPSWGPGGRAIAFVRAENNSLLSSPVDLFRYDVGRRGVRRLTGKGAVEPSWTPNGKNILFVRRGGDEVIYSVQSSGGSLTLVTSGEEGRKRSASLPDVQPRP